MLAQIREQVRVFCEVEPAVLWPLVSDTNQLNQAAGLGAVSVRPNPEGGLPRFLVSSKFGPLTLEWAEYPFQWQVPLRLSVRREVRSGPVQGIEFSMNLEPQSGGCEVTLEIALTPRHRAGQPIAAVAAKVVAHKLAGGVRKLASAEVKARATRAQLNVDAQALDLGLQRLKEEGPAEIQNLLTRLRGLLEHAPDHEVAHIRPYELADSWQASRRLTLQLCLHASVAGLLDLSWDVVCPSCRTASDRVPELKALPESGHCDLCDLGFDLQMDQAVEVSFEPAAALREVQTPEFCTGGPGVMPHVVAQANLQQETPVTVTVPETAGRYRLFARGGAIATVEVEPEQAAQVQVVVGASVTPAQMQVRPGGELQVVLRGASERHIKLEHLGWSSKAATAYEVSTVASFRKYFGFEALKPGLGLQIRRAALFFSDLSASTALYAREGDAAAFRLVQDHFDLMAECIQRHEGAVVKTIGDAVMASFPDERSALAAALDAQRAFVRFRAEQPASDGVFLKIGVFAGPCYAVSANRVLDFFGQTVNIAARLQCQADDAETVISGRLLADLEGDDVLAGLQISAPFVPKLKGVTEGVEVVRLSLIPAPPS